MCQHAGSCESDVCSSEVSILNRKIEKLTPLPPMCLSYSDTKAMGPPVCCSFIDRFQAKLSICLKGDIQHLQLHTYCATLFFYILGHWFRSAVRYLQHIHNG